MQDGRRLGEILIALDDPVRGPRLDARELLALMEPRVLESVHRALAARVDVDGWLDLEDLRAAGIEASYDEANAELDLSTPAGARPVEVVAVQRRKKPEGIENAMRPCAVSGFVNVRGGMGYVQRDPGAGDPRREPFRAATEGAVNVLGWVLESEARYAEGDRDPWTLNGIRLVRDLPDAMLRFTLGDLVPPYRGHLQGRPLGGFSVVRNFALQPYRITHPISRFEFLLDRPSQVQVWVGDRLVQTLHLEAGPHDLRDLPLISGINDVRLVVVDDVGHEETLTFDAISHAELLAPGLQQFAYSIGFPSRHGGAVRNYDWRHPQLLAFHRVGLLDSLTLGGYVHAGLDGAVVGFEGLWASPVGLIGLDAAVSGLRDVARAGALTLRYRNLQTATTRRLQQAWSASVEASGPRFDRPGADVLRPYRLGVSAAYGQSLFQGVHGTLGATYRLSGSEPRHAYQVDLTLSRRLWRNAYLSVVGSQVGDSGGRSFQRVVANLVWTLPGNHTLSDAFDSRTLSNRLSWNHGTPRGAQALRAWGDARQGPDGGSLASGVGYTGYRGEVRLTQDVDFPDLALRGSVSAGTALVFANGVFGLSRPVADSFAMVLPADPRLRGRAIRLNPRGGFAAARVDALGPAILPGMTSYHLNRLDIVLPDLPYGHDVGATRFALLPTYRSGFLFPLKVTATVLVRGTLVDHAGRPVVLKAGEVTPLDVDDADPQVMFTNRAGRFAVEGLLPGRYLLRLLSGEGTEARFEIPEDQDGELDVGRILLESIQARRRLDRNARLTRP
jgi:outer membrane usher protein